MRILFAFLIALPVSGAISVPVWAADDQPAAPAAPEAPAAPMTKQARLDKLFSDLKRERNEKAAERIAGNIWSEWFQSGSASIDLMMLWSQKAMDNQKFGVALDFLDQVVTLQPTYAEGWNRRATVHYMMKNFGKSMSDIDHTLQLEPRHFGALSGKGAILRAMGKPAEALVAMKEALTIDPNIAGLKDAIEELQKAQPEL